MCLKKAASGKLDGNDWKSLENELRAYAGKHIAQTFADLLLDDIALLK